MSYCEIVVFENGKPTTSVEYQNAWGGAACIWTALYDRYLKDPENEFDSWFANPRKLWALVDRLDLPLFVRVILASTFDRAIVRRRNFQRFGYDLRDFSRGHLHNKKGHHLLSWADFIEKCTGEAIGFYGTSCGENLWKSHNEETDDFIVYDLNVNDNHFEVYERFGE